MTESESTGFLYPFIESEETDATGLLDDLAGSARSKAAESVRLQRDSLDEYRDTLTTAGAEMADRFRHGGRLYTFGNGGSSTDAATLARYQQAWDHAADRTPHGQPIELTPQDFPRD